MRRRIFELRRQLLAAVVNNSQPPISNDPDSAQALLSIVDQQAIDHVRLGEWCTNAIRKQPSYSALLTLAWIDSISGTEFLVPWLSNSQLQEAALLFGLDVGVSGYRDVADSKHSTSERFEQMLDFCLEWTAGSADFSAKCVPEQRHVLMDAPAANNIFVVGFSGTGKSSSTNLLSKYQSREHIHQADEEIEQACGMPMSRLFELYGPRGVHQLYEDYLHRVTRETNSPSMIVLGSSGCMTQSLRQQVESSDQVIWIDCRTDTAIERLLGAANHAASILAHAPTKAVELIKLVRDSTFYAATVRISSDGVSTADVADRLCELDVNI